jgi:SP family myo-inositol transporter-like MFS transporter 13
MAGFSANPNVPALGVAVGNFLGTCLALRLVDRLGRRRLLLGATAAASVALSMLAVSLGQIHMKDVVDGQGDVPAGEQAGAWAYVSLVMVSGLRDAAAARLTACMQMIAFIFSYALGLGIIPVCAGRSDTLTAC